MGFTNKHGKSASYAKKVKFESDIRDISFIRVEERMGEYKALFHGSWGDSPLFQKWNFGPEFWLTEDELCTRINRQAWRGIEADITWNAYAEVRGKNDERKPILYPVILLQRAKRMFTLGLL